MGAREIELRLGVSRQRVQQLTTRPDWPEPYARLAMGKVWRAADIEGWIARHRPGARSRSAARSGPAAASGSEAGSRPAAGAGAGGMMSDLTAEAWRARLQTATDENVRRRAVQGAARRATAERRNRGMATRQGLRQTRLDARAMQEQLSPTGGGVSLDCWAGYGAGRLTTPPPGR